jgi:synaptobrevin homolog YKT6
MITFFSKTICKRTPPGQRQTVENQGLPPPSITSHLFVFPEYLVHVFMRSDGLCACATVDKEYPPRVAFSLLSKILEDFDSQISNWRTQTVSEAISWPPLDEAVVKYQDPSQADQIMRIQRNLDETKDILYNTIETVLERGERLEDLVDRSGELSAQSKLFYKQAKKTNSCCAVV